MVREALAVQGLTRLSRQDRRKSMHLLSRLDQRMVERNDRN